MHTQLDLLRNLQKIDTRVQVLEEEKQRLQEELDLLAAEEGEVGAQVEVLQNKIMEAEMERRRKDLELGADQQKIRKWEQRLVEVQNHREYQALHSEIHMARKACSDLETELLALMEVLDADRKALEQLKEQLAEANAAVVECRTRTGVRAAELDAQVAEIETERRGIEAAVERRFLDRYEMIRKRRNGLAVIAARDGTCTACHMNLPPQLYNELFRGDRLHFCPSCQRIVVLDEQADRTPNRAASMRGGVDE